MQVVFGIDEKTSKNCAEGDFSALKLVVKMPIGRDSREKTDAARSGAGGVGDAASAARKLHDSAQIAIRQHAPFGGWR